MRIFDYANVPQRKNHSDTVYFFYFLLLACLLFYSFFTQVDQKANEQIAQLKNTQVITIEKGGETK